MAAADTCCVTRVEARFDPRRILKAGHLSALATRQGVEARFDPRRILKGNSAGGKYGYVQC